MYQKVIAKSYNSAKNHRTGTGLQYAKLGLISIIVVKFHEIPTYGFREIVFTRNVNRRTDGPTDRRTDSVTPILPPYTYYLGV